MRYSKTLKSLLLAVAILAPAVTLAVLGLQAFRAEALLLRERFRQDQAAIVRLITERLSEAAKILANSPIGMEGMDELRTLMECLDAQDIPESRVIIDFSLARGLEIYNGPVYECEVPSLSSPGRPQATRG